VPKIAKVRIEENQERIEAEAFQFLPSIRFDFPDALRHDWWLDPAMVAWL
jgi:hypothetical protein